MYQFEILEEGYILEDYNDITYASEGLLGNIKDKVVKFFKWIGSMITKFIEWIKKLIIRGRKTGKLGTNTDGKQSKSANKEEDSRNNDENKIDISESLIKDLVKKLDNFTDDDVKELENELNDVADEFIRAMDDLYAEELKKCKTKYEKEMMELGAKLVDATDKEEIEKIQDKMRWLSNKHAKLMKMKMMTSLKDIKNKNKTTKRLKTKIYIDPDKKTMSGNGFNQVGNKEGINTIYYHNDESKIAKIVKRELDNLNTAIGYLLNLNKLLKLRSEDKDKFNKITDSIILINKSFKFNNQHYWTKGYFIEYDSQLESKLIKNVKLLESLKKEVDSMKLNNHSDSKMSKLSRAYKIVINACVEIIEICNGSTEKRYAEELKKFGVDLYDEKYRS